MSSNLAICFQTLKIKRTAPYVSNTALAKIRIFFTKKISTFEIFKIEIIPLYVLSCRSYYISSLHKAQINHFLVSRASSVYQWYAREWEISIANEMPSFPHLVWMEIVTNLPTGMLESLCKSVNVSFDETQCFSCFPIENIDIT